MFIAQNYVVREFYVLSSLMHNQLSFSQLSLLTSVFLKIKIAYCTLMYSVVTINDQIVVLYGINIINILMYWILFYFILFLLLY